MLLAMVHSIPIIYSKSQRLKLHRQTDLHDFFVWIYAVSSVHHHCVLYNLCIADLRTVTHVYYLTQSIVPPILLHRLN